MVPKFEETINKYLRDSVVGNIYIHCQCGINRSGILGSAFRM